MFRQSFVFFIVALEMFLCTALQPTINMFHITTIILVTTLKNKKRFVVTYQLRVNTSISTTTERKIIYCIKEVGLSHPIMTYQAINFGRQFERCLTYIPVINNGYFLQYHLRLITFYCKVTPFMNEKRKKSARNFNMWIKFLNFALQMKKSKQTIKWQT